MSGDSKCSTIHNLFLKFSLNQCYFLCKRENGGVDVVKSRMQSTVTNVISFFIIPYQKRIVLLFNPPPPPYHISGRNDRCHFTKLRVAICRVNLFTVHFKGQRMYANKIEKYEKGPCPWWRQLACVTWAAASRTRRLIRSTKRRKSLQTSFIRDCIIKQNYFDTPAFYAYILTPGYHFYINLTSICSPICQRMFYFLTTIYGSYIRHKRFQKGNFASWAHLESGPLLLIRGCASNCLY